MAERPRTLVEKIWDDHVVASDPGAPAILAIDLHLVHEVTSPQAFTGLRERGLKVRKPGQTVATADHSIPTLDPSLPIARRAGRASSCAQIEENCREFGIPFHGQGSPTRGIVHVIGPELGLTPAGHDHRLRRLPHRHARRLRGAGVRHRDERGRDGPGHADAAPAQARRPSRSRSTGRLQPGVGAKDIILALIARIGIGGGTGHVFEYTGDAIRALSMEERMTICNMSIEGGARAGLIAPDETTFAYLQGPPVRAAGRGLGRGRRPLAQAADATRARPTTERSSSTATRSSRWSPTAPTRAWACRSPAGFPDPADVEPAARARPRARARLHGPRARASRSPARSSTSSSSGRAPTAGSRTCAPRPRSCAAATSPTACACWSCPGSQQVKTQAESEGLDEVFRAAGAEWRESGCSMCIAMNGDQLEPGQYGISTSNRNFEGRQGKGGRTFLASPLTAAASAVTGVVTDPRTLPGVEPAGRAVRPWRPTDMPEPFVKTTSRVIPIPRANIDTDQICPARFLKITDKAGLADAPLLRLALHAGRRRGASRLRSSTSPRTPAARSCWPATTSAPAPRASTRPGRCGRGASGPSSRPASPTSSAATP